VHDKLTRLPLFHLKSVMLDHFVAKNATTHTVNSYDTLATSYHKFYVGKHTILGPVRPYISNKNAYVPPTFPYL